MADITTLRTYIENALYKRDQARQNKDSYYSQAEDSKKQGDSYYQKSEDLISWAKQYENDEYNAQKDLEYYMQQASYAEQEAEQARQEAQA